MKLHHLMENKISRAEFRLGYDDACADGVEFDMAGKVDYLEVNANAPPSFCAHDSLTSPKSPYDDAGFVDNNRSEDTPVCTDSLKVCSVITEDSGISENSFSLVDEIEADKSLYDITERAESLDEVTDSEESSSSSVRDRADRFGNTASGQCFDHSRTINQIRGSLEEKVKRLRDEKAAVDEKIRLAQEEEELRMREKTKLKQQLVVHRRDRLKKVIGDLKRKLEDQSARLQVTYSTLISLQRNVFRHRSFSRPNKAPEFNHSSLEAPF